MLLFKLVRWKRAPLLNWLALLPRNCGQKMSPLLGFLFNLKMVVVFVLLLIVSVMVVIIVLTVFVLGISKDPLMVKLGSLSVGLLFPSLSFFQNHIQLIIFICWYFQTHER